MHLHDLPSKSSAGEEHKDKPVRKHVVHTPALPAWSETTPGTGVRMRLAAQRQVQVSKSGVVSFVVKNHDLFRLSSTLFVYPDIGIPFHYILG